MALIFLILFWMKHFPAGISGARTQSKPYLVFIKLKGMAHRVRHCHTELVICTGHYFSFIIIDISNKILCANEVICNMLSAFWQFYSTKSFWQWRKQHQPRATIHITESIESAPSEIINVSGWSWLFFAKTHREWLASMLGN